MSLPRLIACLGTLLATTLLPLATVYAASSWEDESGLTQLRAELGAATPTGAGVRVTQSEALSGGGYYPEAGGPTNFAGSGANNYLGITFMPQSGAQPYSGHAAGVASRLFDRSSGIAPGVTEVTLMTANDEINWTRGAISLPTSDIGRVFNSSWVGTTNNVTYDTQAIDGNDSKALSMGFLHCVGIQNSTSHALPVLGSHFYNSLSVGKKDGNHSYGTTGASYPGSGRMKPDLVGVSSTSSATTPEVAGCAALLFETVDNNAALSNADDPNVIRAILLSGANKNGHAQWNRADQSRPYDTVFGAGQVNVYNSYHILAGGEHTASEVTPAALKGWAKPNSVSQQRFLIQVPDGKYADELTVTLSWFRNIQDGRDTGAGSNQRDDLHVILYSRDGSGTLTEIDRCQSPVDNVQHIFRRHLEPGDYLIEVPQVISHTTGSWIFETNHGFDYALAWRTELGTGPGQSAVAGQAGVVDFANLDPAASYTVERTTTLNPPAWVTVGTLPAAERFTETFTDPTPPTGSAFYRINWINPATAAAP